MISPSDLANPVLRFFFCRTFATMAQLFFVFCEGVHGKKNFFEVELFVHLSLNVLITGGKVADLSPPLCFMYIYIYLPIFCQG